MCLKNEGSKRKTFNTKVVRWQKLDGLADKTNHPVKKTESQ